MEHIRRNGHKYLAMALLAYVIVWGLLGPVPSHPVIHETIRNLYFHVGMWFSMIFILFVSMLFSIRHLRKFDPVWDRKSLAAVKTGLVFGLLGLITGMIWARATWGVFWTNDPKLNGAALGMLAYMAYMLLRASVGEDGRKAKLASVYNIFAFVLFFIFIMIIPRMATASLHPGIEANPALVPGDLAPQMRWVFYPAILGWILLAWWIYGLVYRIDEVRFRLREQMENQ